MVVVLVVFVVDFFLVDYDKDYESDNEGLKKRVPDSVLNPALESNDLSTKLKLFENRGVAIEVGALEVVEQLTAASCHRDEAAA